MPILEVRELVKQYPKVRAVDGVSFAIEEGRVLGLLGPNGAGKTTTVEMIEGITPPTAGEIVFRGEPVDRRTFANEMGIQFQQTALQDFLRVGEVLRLFQRLYARHLSLDEVVEMCSLGDILDRDASKLSGGQRQRVLLALALVNDSTILLLDEPTTGLDPQARRNVWELVREVKRRGRTVMMTTHYMEEAYVLCDEIAIMDHGRIIAQGEPRRLLREQFEGSLIELPKEVDLGETFPWPHFEREGHREIQTDDVNATLSHLLAEGVPLDQLQVKSRTLEDLFLTLTGRDLRS